MAPRSSASLGEWLRWLETLSPREIDLGLTRVQTVLERLQLPRPSRVLTVGGTNGKGSSVTLLAALLTARGEVTGSYTSPHILQYNERIRLDGVAAQDRSIVSAFNAIEEVRADVPLTYFEYGTLAALSLFAAARVDAIVLEVGLGGRLDAVNAIDPDACLITNISLDHCDWLGNDIESIAREKAGIMRPQRPAVFAGRTLPAAIGDAAYRLGADLWVAGRDFLHSVRADGRWDWSGREHTLSGLAPLRLKGAHQLENAAGVLALLEAVGQKDLLEPAVLDPVLTTVGIAGRLERVCAANRHWLIDGAHNPAGAEALARALESEAPGSATVGICGILDDKDAAGIIGALSHGIDQWIAIAADTGRAIPAERLGLLIASVTGRPCRVASSMDDALRAAVRQSGPGDTIVVAGSFYTVAAATRGLAQLAA